MKFGRRELIWRGEGVFIPQPPKNSHWQVKFGDSKKFFETPDSTFGNFGDAWRLRTCLNFGHSAGIPCLDTPNLFSETPNISAEPL
jgi:hypothetical protein